MMPASPVPRIPAEFLRFAVAGGVGFAIDTALLIAFTSLLHWDPLVAKPPAFAVAVFATWLLNRAWTFQATGKAPADIGAEFASYGAVQLTGGAANFVVYAAIVSLIGKTPIHLFLATAAGAGAGFVINYLGARRFVFRKA